MTKKRRPRKPLTILALTFMAALSACGGGKGSAATPGPTDQDKVAQLEASGALPRLERLPMLEGVDVNANGVRDDIESHILRKYSDSSQQRAAMQTARAFQAMLLVDKNDAIALEAVSEAMSRTVVCSISAFPVAGREGDAMFDELRSLTTNTKPRLQAYLDYNKARSGTVVTLPEGGACE